MNDERRFKMTEVTDGRLQQLDPAAASRIGNFAKEYFSGVGRLSECWMPGGGGGRCVVLPVAQDRWDYEDMDTREPLPASFDFKFAVAACRKSDSVAFNVWCVVPLKYKDDRVAMLMQCERARGLLESFANCPCTSVVTCDAHRIQGQSDRRPPAVGGPV